MKQTILLLLLSTQLFAQCPITGDGKTKKDWVSDSLKNRNITSDISKSYDISTFFFYGDDTQKFSQDSYVKVRGYITEVKWGGKEQCNCHSSVRSEKDIHIVFSDSLGKNKMICEVNRYTRATNQELTIEYVKNLIGVPVVIEGWLFADIEHKHNATNTCVKCTQIWRTTLWEIHPVMNIWPYNGE